LAEAINYANYTVNRIPTKALKNITLEEEWTKIKPYVSHFCVFGSEAWAHILDEKRKTFKPKSEKFIFVGYSEDVKGYILLQPHSNEIIIRRDVNFDENLSNCKSNLVFMPSMVIYPSSVFVPSSIPILVYFLDDDNKDENPPPQAHLPLDESIEHEPTPVPLLHRWVFPAQEATCDLSSDPTNKHRACFLVPTMNEEYNSLMANDKWELVPLSKERELIMCK
jgi:hypothetical protein